MSTAAQRAALIPQDALPDLAAQIRGETEAVDRDLQSALGHAIRAGELLIEAKRLVGHGGWLPWLDANFEFTQQTASAYMRLHLHREQITGGPVVSINAALKLLAKPRQPEPQESKPPWWPMDLRPLPDDRPAADPAEEARLHQCVRAATAELERAVTLREEAVAAYRQYLEGHRPGTPLVAEVVVSGWERENHEALYRRWAA